MSVRELVSFGGHELHVIGHDTHVTVIAPRSRACASIDRIHADAEWWVSRVSIPKPEHRGSGLGSFLLQLALETVCKLDQHPSVIVEPSGYGSDPQRQRVVFKSDLGNYAIITMWRGFDPYLVHLESTISVKIFEVMPFLPTERADGILLRLTGPADQRRWLAVDRERFDAYTEREAIAHHRTLLAQAVAQMS